MRKVRDVYYLASTTYTKEKPTSDQVVNTLKAYLAKKKALNYKTFEEFINTTSLFKEVCISQNDWHQSTCSCSHFQKHYICKHILLVCVHLNIVDLPHFANETPLGSKPSRGRKKLVKNCLAKD